MNNILVGGPCVVVLAPLAPRCAGYYFSRSVVALSAEAIATVQQQLLPGSVLPADFTPQLGMSIDVLGIDLVVIKGPSHHAIVLTDGTNESIKRGKASVRRRAGLDDIPLDESALEPLGDEVLAVGPHSGSCVKRYDCQASGL